MDDDKSSSGDNGHCTAGVHTVGSGAIPKYGLKLLLNHEYPEKWDQHRMPRIRQILSLLPLILRYILYYIKAKLTGKSIVMDYIQLVNAQQIYGVPIGGLGSGTIGRGFRGEFCRFQLKPGIYEYDTVDANQFIVTIKDEHQLTIFHSLLSVFPRTSLKCWQSHLKPEKCSYTGLYPRAWTEYDLSEYGIKLVCRQISPIFPHNYKDTALPCAVFVWQVYNINCNAKRTVTIAFTFKNGTGNRKEDRAATCSSKDFAYGGTEGVILYHTINKMRCTYALASKSSGGNAKQPPAVISKCLHFNPNSDGSKPWNQLRADGRFERVPCRSFGHVFGEMASGIASKVTLSAFEQRTIEMCLVWHMPTVTFAKDSEHQQLDRYYVQKFGRNSVLRIVQYALENYSRWEREIEAWQTPILNDPTLPDWYKTALFNESYYLSDGGSLWVTVPERNELPTTDPRRTVGRFFYLEGHEYRMCNTYDVHFYASSAMVRNFPQLQLSIQYDMRDAVAREITARRWMIYDGRMVERKVGNTTPHDVGDPGEVPFRLINAYPVHDVSEWRDLNVKFVLQVFRDSLHIERLSGGGRQHRQYLDDMYETCVTLMRVTQRFDIDGDGVIENGGTPDQTFDTWVMTGTSAYCGGLWLGALFAMTHMAHTLNRPDDAERYSALLGKGVASFNRKLWNGDYYSFDCSLRHHDSIMADQLCAHWYLRMCGFAYEVYAADKVKCTLRTILANNVRGFCDGEMGAVNGYVKNVGPDPCNVQSEEVWIGVTYALASTMIYEGMEKEGFLTAEGMYTTLTSKIGMAFSTPEALYASKHYRSVGYMRPLSIWSMQMAHEFQQKAMQKRST